ncbi:hypothetical protein D3C76_1367420 [compost metagenome]
MLAGLDQHTVDGSQSPRRTRRRPAEGGVGLHRELLGLAWIKRIDGSRQVQREQDQQAAQQNQRVERQGEHAGQVVQVEQAPRRLVCAQGEQILKQTRMDAHPCDQGDQPDHRGQAQQPGTEVPGIDVQGVMKAVEKVTATASGSRHFTVVARQQEPTEAFALDAPGLKTQQWAASIG